MTILADNFWQYLAIILKISVWFTQKQLRCELSSYFDIILDSEKRDILFLQIAVVFELKKKEGE